ncbi:PX domain-containing protein [Giardia muris]|uniref:PX domain-containing protein n=1 Tax=Giardia muris TaxID=5742 RepID=A0A4Z1SS30_GIAMU|nr:PX domain-containing protein [Giardia muris]|eukprot:TNJ28570.1 PX domain-containing protein [Giardia muris]
MSAEPDVQTLILEMLKGRTDVSVDEALKSCAARLSALASYLSTVCSSYNPLDWYRLLFNTVLQHPQPAPPGGRVCPKCSAETSSYIQLRPCQHSFCVSCVKQLVASLDDRCYVCDEPAYHMVLYSARRTPVSTNNLPVRNVEPSPLQGPRPDSDRAGAFSPPAPEYVSMVTPPSFLGSSVSRTGLVDSYVTHQSEYVQSTTSLLVQTANETVRCPLFTHLLTQHCMGLEAAGYAYGYPCMRRINILDEVNHHADPDARISIADLLYLRDVMGYQSLFYYDTRMAELDVVCDWMGRDPEEHCLECALHREKCRNAAKGCPEEHPRVIMEMHGASPDDVCGYDEVACPLCQEVFLTKDLYDHEVTCAHHLIDIHRKETGGEHEQLQKILVEEVGEGSQLIDDAKDIEKALRQEEEDARQQAILAEQEALRRKLEESRRTLLQMQTEEEDQRRERLIAEIVRMGTPAESIRQQDEDLTIPTMRPILSKEDEEREGDRAEIDTDLSPRVLEELPRPPDKVFEEFIVQDQKYLSESRESESNLTYKVKILSYHVYTTGHGHPFVAYQFNIESDDGDITICKRMNDIKSFHKLATKAFPGVELPRLPRDRPWFFGGNKKVFVDERAGLLEQYMTSLHSNPCIRKSRLYKEYLEQAADFTPSSYGLK